MPQETENFLRKEMTQFVQPYMRDCDGPSIGFVSRKRGLRLKRVFSGCRKDNHNYDKFMAELTDAEMLHLYNHYIVNAALHGGKAIKLRPLGEW